MIIKLLIVKKNYLIRCGFNELRKKFCNVLKVFRK